MCAIIGASLEAPTEKQIETLKRVFLESQIRGMHACGLSYVQNNRVTTLTEPLPAEVFLSKHFNTLAENALNAERFEVIGHCRYSTSDLQYNQPIQVFNDLAIVHNGVIDQRPASYWQEYGYELKTANDSELVYQCSYSGREPLEEFPEASMAVAELSSERGLRWYRNGKRPLYFSKEKNGYIICSTKDIALRAGLEGARRCIPGVVYTAEGRETLKEIEELIP